VLAGRSDSCTTESDSMSSRNACRAAEIDIHRSVGILLQVLILFRRALTSHRPGDWGTVALKHQSDSNFRSSAKSR
jgi:cytochrome b561